MLRKSAIGFGCSEGDGFIEYGSLRKRKSELGAIEAFASQSKTHHSVSSLADRAKHTQNQAKQQASLELQKHNENILTNHFKISSLICFNGKLTNNQILNILKPTL